MRFVSSFQTKVLWDFDQHRLSVHDRLAKLNWDLLLLVGLIFLAGFFALYSAAQGNLEPWAIRHARNFFIGLSIFFFFALIDIRFWMHTAYLFYGLGLVLLLGVEIVGQISSGSQRWIRIGGFNLQASELMKFFLIFTLARYFHHKSYEQMGNILWLLPVFLMILVPAGIVLVQPDLGTAFMLLVTGFFLLFTAGLRYWKAFAFVLIGFLSIIAIFRFDILSSYQMERIGTFLNPEASELNAGYQIMQSKIAIGSGGLVGKGFLNGTQSQLSFLPEKQTDFIFALISEEFGYLGALFILALYGILIAYLIIRARQIPHQFGRLFIFGAAFNIFLYVAINVGMVTGSVPVVGVPLPLISNGGSVIFSVLASLGLAQSILIDRDTPIGRFSVEPEKQNFYTT